MSREEQKKAWREQSHRNVLAKQSIEGFGWKYDPNNPLSEEQKKVWQAQGHKNVLAKNSIEAFGWKYDPNNPLSEEQKKAWQAQSHKNVLAKNSIEAFGWKYDPNNPLNKEEQKKAWQDQSHKNVLAKKAVDAFLIEKKPLTMEEKKARWKADATGKKAFCVDALTVSDKKKKVESEANYIMNYGGRSSLSTANDLEPLTAINIVMTTAKAKCGISLLLVH